MRPQHFSLGVAGVLAASFLSLSAYANNLGVIGRSGKQGTTCMAAGCHNTNPNPATPTVTINGPATLAAGATGNYTLIIQGGAGVKGGMNVAVSDNGGTLNKVGTDVKVVSGELTHTAGKPFANGEVRFDFTLVAPSTARTVTLYASGNSTNDDKSFTMDRSDSKTLEVTITGGTTSPDAGVPDGGTNNPDDGEGAKEEDSGCAAAGGAPMVVLLALVAARLRRRNE
ncbi:MXAN_6652 family MXYO-CTERM-anchored protein [Hyalangium gracile]|uniref:MXAN_6652 family MXYO-CTERM-anchored protein n=1 Tax=Hyalangium gracile TaxID=394092 RepID=UPI001CCDDFCF|nr:MXAN_6652 family MXYO-CTERM-anchored protein [Hyalangium gracile]